MEIIIVIALVAIISYISKRNKQKQEEAKKAAQAAAAKADAGNAPAQPRYADPRFPEGLPKRTASPYFPDYEPPAQPAASYDERFPTLDSGGDMRRRQAQAAEEARAREFTAQRKQFPGRATSQVQEQKPEQHHHNLKILHAVSREVDDPVSSFDQSQASKKETAPLYGKTALPFMLDNRESLIAGIIFSELYGPPKALRKRR